MLKDKVPPHSIEAEQAALGALLLQPSSFDTIVTLIRSKDFYKPGHRVIFDAILNLNQKGSAVDILTLSEYLTTHNQLEQTGGVSYVSQLTNSVPTAANLEYYTKIIKDTAKRRELIHFCEEILVSAYDESIETRRVIEEAQKKIYELTESETAHTYKRTREILPKVVEAIHLRHKNKDQFTGLATGFSRLDSMTSGFHSAEMIIIAARPSIGKTTFALNIASYMAIHKGVRVGFFTLEMPDMDIYDRIIAGEAKLDAQKIRNGLLKASDFQNLKEAVPRIYEAEIFTDDTPGISLLQLRAQARRMKVKENIQILFIDYISLITSEEKNVPRHEMVAEFSRSLKSLARELEIPVVVLAQVSRETEGKAPTLANLRESGSLEQDADVVLFLHRNRGEKETENTSNLIVTELIIAKQRKGPVGTLKIAFLPNYTRFENYEDDGD